MLNQAFIMELGDLIKKVREAKGLSQKEVALACKMDQSQYSRVERGITDPSFSVVARIAKGLGVEVSDLFRAEEVFRDVSSYDRSLMEKMAMVEQLDQKEQQAFFAILDSLVAKKKLTDTLSNALSHAG